MQSPTDERDEHTDERDGLPIESFSGAHQYRPQCLVKRVRSNRPDVDPYRVSEFIEAITALIDEGRVLPVRRTAAYSADPARRLAGHPLPVCPGLWTVR